MRITFWGAAGTVTGSRFLVETSGGRVLVDCGMFQGLKALRLRNWETFPFDPASVDAVVLTHAHIDHSGCLPLLVRNGFSGPIWCTGASAELAEILLLDSAHLHEEEARFRNKHRTTRHDPALPLYTTDDAEAAIARLRPQRYSTTFAPVPGTAAELRPAGHILGSAGVVLEDGSTSVFFTGDVGRPHDPVMLPPAPPPASDVVVTESTYGDRRHPDTNPADDLADVVTRTLGRGGTVLIPVFAVGRAQTILHLLSELRAAGKIPAAPTYLNSPMAIDATELLFRHTEEHRIPAELCDRISSDVTFVRTAEESKALTPLRGPMIVLSASGMLSGGRVLHHLLTVAPDHRSTIALVGHQAAGTRGEALLAGADHIEIFGEDVPVRAEVVRLDNLSAHADVSELTSWLRSAEHEPRRAFVVHGEASASEAFRRTLRHELGWAADVPTHGETVTIST